MSRIVQDLRRRCGTESNLGQRYLLNTGDNNISAQHTEGWSRNWLFANTIPVLRKNKHKNQPNKQQKPEQPTNKNKANQHKQTRSRQNEEGVFGVNFLARITQLF